MTIIPPFREGWRLSQGFGVNPQAYAKFGLKGHNGLDYACPTGTTIIACDDGKVVTVADDPTGYGHYLKIAHSWGESIYAHLQNHLVTPGFLVKRGQAIAISNNTGNSTGPHLHFGIRINPYNKQDGYSGYSDPSLYYGPDKPSEPPTEEFSMREKYKLIFSVLHSKPNPTEADIDMAVGSALPPYEYGVNDLNNRVIPVTVDPYEKKILKLQEQLMEANEKIIELEKQVAQGMDNSPEKPDTPTGGENSNSNPSGNGSNPGGSHLVRLFREIINKIIDFFRK